MENLDLECAKLGRTLAGLESVEEKLLTNALSVLEEQGLYACFLYLKAREVRAGQRLIERCAQFLQQVPPGAALLGAGDVFTALQTLTGNLDKLLFARDLMRQALVYGRYHAKGDGGGKA